MQRTYTLLLSKHAVAVSNQHTTIGHRERGGDHIVVKIC